MIKYQFVDKRPYFKNGKNMWEIIISLLGIIIIGGGILLSVLKRIPFPEVWIVDRRGELIEKKPGYRIIIEYFGFEKIYAKIKAGVQYSIPLFPDKEKILIDLKEGGQIILKDPRIWILVKEPLKTFKTAANFEEQIREIAEHRITGAINTLTFEEVMEMKTPKMMKKKKMVEKLDEIIEKSEGLQEFLKSCGIEYKGFTLDDFDFDEKTTQRRFERIKSEMEIEISQKIAEARKNEMSAITKIFEELIKAGFSKEEAQKIASERYQDHLIAKEGKIQKIIWSGREGISETSVLWEMGKKILGGISEPPEEKERKPKKKRPEDMTHEELVEEMKKSKFKKYI